MSSVGNGGRPPIPPKPPILPPPSASAARPLAAPNASKKPIADGLEKIDTNSWASGADPAAKPSPAAPSKSRSSDKAGPPPPPGLEIPRRDYRAGATFGGFPNRSVLPSEVDDNNQAIIRKSSGLHFYANRRPIVSRAFLERQEATVVPLLQHSAALRPRESYAIAPPGRVDFAKAAAGDAKMFHRQVFAAEESKRIVVVANSAMAGLFDGSNSLLWSSLALLGYSFTLVRDGKEYVIDNAELFASMVAALPGKAPDSNDLAIQAMREKGAVIVDNRLLAQLLENSRQNACAADLLLPPFERRRDLWTDASQPFATADLQRHFESIKYRHENASADPVPYFQQRQAALAIALGQQAAESRENLSAVSGMGQFTSKYNKASSNELRLGTAQLELNVLKLAEHGDNSPDAASGHVVHHSGQVTDDVREHPSVAEKSSQDPSFCKKMRYVPAAFASTRPRISLQEVTHPDFYNSCSHYSEFKTLVFLAAQKIVRGIATLSPEDFFRSRKVSHGPMDVVALHLDLLMDIIESSESAQDDAIATASQCLNDLLRAINAQAIAGSQLTLVANPALMDCLRRLELYGDAGQRELSRTIRDNIRKAGPKNSAAQAAATAKLSSDSVPVYQPPIPNAPKTAPPSGMFFDHETPGPKGKFVGSKPWYSTQKSSAFYATSDVYGMNAQGKLEAIDMRTCVSKSQGKEAQPKGALHLYLEGTPMPSDAKGAHYLALPVPFGTSPISIEAQTGTGLLRQRTKIPSAGINLVQDKYGRWFVVFEKAPKFRKLVIEIADDVNAKNPTSVPKVSDVPRVNLAKWPELEALIRRIKPAAGASATPAQVAELVAFLRAHLTYSKSVDTREKFRGSNVSHLDTVVETRCAVCHDAAVLTMALVQGELNCPAYFASGNIVNSTGFRGGHAWSQVYFANEGWLRFDATPVNADAGTRLLLSRDETASQTMLRAAAREFPSGRVENKPVAQIAEAPKPRVQSASSASTLLQLPESHIGDAVRDSARTQLLLVGNQSEGLATACALQQQLGADAALYIDAMAQLDEAQSAVEISPTGELRLAADSLWQRVLRGQATLIVNYDNLSAREAESLSELCGTPARLNGRMLDPAPRIIGICSRSRLSAGLLSADVVSPFNKKSRMSQIAPIPLQVHPVANLSKELAAGVDVNAQEAPNWRENLLGNYRLKYDGSAEWVEGPLLVALKSNRRPVVLRNLPDDGALLVFLNQLQHQGQLRVNGATYELRDPIVFAKGHTATEFEVMRLHDVSRLSANSHHDTAIDAHVNAVNFEQLFQLSETRDGYLDTSKPGLLELIGRQKTPVTLCIDSPLQEWQWNRLLLVRPALDLRLAPGVVVPSQFGIRLAPSKAATPPAKNPPIRSIITEDTGLATANIRATAARVMEIDIHPDMDASELISTLDITSAPNRQRQYQLRAQPMWAHLQSGGTVVMRGLEHNPALQQELASLLAPPYCAVVGDKFEPLSGNIVIVQEASTPATKLLPGERIVPNEATIPQYHAHIAKAFPGHEVPQEWVPQIAQALATKQLPVTLQTVTKVVAICLSRRASDGAAMSPSSLFNAINTAVLCDEFGDSLVDHTQGYLRLLRHHPALFLQGPPGAGKSHSARNIAESLRAQNGGVIIGPVTVGGATNAAALIGESVLQNGRTTFVPGPVAQWALADAGVLIIDEANMANPELWRMLQGLFETPRHILINGKRVELSDKHKVIFTGNAISTSGRFVSQVIARDFVTAHVAELSEQALLEKIIGPAVTAQLGDLQIDTNHIATHLAAIYSLVLSLAPPETFSPRNMLEVLLRVSIYLREDGNLNSAMSRAVMEVLAGRLDSSGKEELAAYCSENFGATLPAASPGISAAVANALHVRDARIRNAELSAGGGNHASAIGQPALLIEGPSGSGKKRAIEDELIRQGYVAGNLSDPPASKDARRYYQIKAGGMSFNDLRAVLARAQREGAVVLISRLDLLPPDILDGELNAALTGFAKSGEAIDPGFTIIATTIPNASEPLSNALRNRMVAAQGHELSRTEIAQILGNNAPAQQIADYHQSVLQKCTGRRLRPTAHDAVAVHNLTRDNPACSVDEALARVYGVYVA